MSYEKSSQANKNESAKKGYGGWWFLPLMVHYFGMSYTLLVTFYIAIFSVLHGWLVEKIIQKTLPAQK